jgi:hypothetical protein
MDVEYWLRLLVAGRKFRQFHETVAAYRAHATSKTSAQNETSRPASVARPRRSLPGSPRARRRASTGTRRIPSTAVGGTPERGGTHSATCARAAGRRCRALGACSRFR